MTITTCHKQYTDYIDRWAKNRAACSGQDAVKAMTTDFLPDDGEGDKRPEAKSRYLRYLLRATWFPCSGYTVEGLIGMVFRKTPAVELPTELEYMMEDANGAGQSLEQLAKLATTEVIKVGRIGLLAEYPVAEPGLSRTQINDRQLRALITTYLTEAIDNWRYDMVDGKLKLTMVKLIELTEVAKDEFTIASETRYRVLRLRDGVYSQAVYNDKEDIVIDEFTPLQADGTTFDHIPFQFVGAEDNLPDVNKAVISGIVDLNIAHYQLSADSMKNLHIHSGGMLVVSSEMSVESWKEYNPNGIVVGADTGLFVGPNGSAQMLQLQSSDAVEGKLKSIESQMLAVGAHLITERGDNETAEAARIDASSKASALLTASDNVSEAMEAALEDAARFMGGDPEIVEFKLNREFYPSNMTAQDAMTLIQLQDRGIIAKQDTRSALRGTVYLSDDRTDADIDESAIEVEPIASFGAGQGATE